MIPAKAIEAAIDAVLQREGGFVDHPHDKGGPTNRGITLETLVSWRFPQRVTVDDLRNLPESEARDIYRARYITGPKFHELTDVRLFDLLIDCAINHGQSRAVKWLQLAVGAQPDGAIGAATLSLLSLVNPSKVYKRVLATRLKFYAHIAAQDHTQIDFIEGWIDRGCQFLDPLELTP